MKIDHMEILLADMPKQDPEWRFARGADPVHFGLVLKLVSVDGLIGLGYLSYYPRSGFTTQGVQAALEVYAEALKGQDIFNSEKIFETLDQVLAGNTNVQAAIDMALHDLRAKALNLPLYALLGGLVRESVPMIRILALKEPVQMAANALKLVEEGYSYIKIKINGEVDKDLERVKEIRRAVGDSIHLTVDANESYHPKAAIYNIKRMQEYGLDLCEQPVRADDIQGLAAVTRAVDCVVEAHQGIGTLGNLIDLVKARVADSFNLGARSFGGLRNARIATTICDLGNVSCRISAIGSRIEAAAGLHVAATTRNLTYACQLAEFDRMLDDPAEGLEVDHGKLEVSSEPGLGVSLRSEMALVSRVKVA